MDQLDKDARLIASRILESDGHASFAASRVFEDLCQMAKSLLKSPQRPWANCDEQTQYPIAARL